MSMTDNKDSTDDKKPSTGGTLSMRRPVEGGSRIKQSFSGGVTKSVAVEVARRRVLKPGETAQAVPQSDVDARRLEALKNVGKEPPKRTLAFTPETVLAAQKAEREAAAQKDKRTLTPDELRARELAELESIESGKAAPWYHSCATFDNSSASRWKRTRCGVAWPS